MYVCIQCEKYSGLSLHRWPQNPVNMNFLQTQSFKRSLEQIFVSNVEV